MSGVQVNINT